MLPTRKEIDDFHELMGWPLIEFSDRPKFHTKAIKITSDGYYMACDCPTTCHPGLNCVAWVEAVRSDYKEEHTQRRIATTQYLTLIGKQRVA